MLTRAKLEDLKQDLVRDEGIRLKPYRCSAGKLTIGIGRNLEDKGISETEAVFMLESDIDDAIANTVSVLGWDLWFNLSANRQRALINMCFNLGRTGFSGFKRMIAALQAEDFETAATEALDSRWASQVGKRADRIAKMLRRG